jgi:hypothetical protein
MVENYAKSLQAVPAKFWESLFFFVYGGIPVLCEKRVRSFLKHLPFK